MHREAGFTRTELVVVVLSTVVLLLASMPVMFKYYERRTENACVANLMQIDTAVQSWALENHALTNTFDLTNTTYRFVDIVPYLKGSTLPVCPRGGIYSPGTNISEMPRCTFPGHVF
jgi:type II secretory pathway pseudopilin PulG